MLGVTLFGIFLTPVFYYVIQRFGTVSPRPPAHQQALEEPPQLVEMASSLTD